MALLKRKEVDMLHGNLLKNIILFSIPVMLSGILQLLSHYSYIFVFIKKIKYNHLFFFLLFLL